MSAIELGTVAVAAPFLLFPGRGTPWGVALILASWCARWRVTGRLSVTTPLDLPLLLLAVMAAVGYLTSAWPDVSAQESLGVVLGIAVYYSLANQRLSPVQAVVWLCVVGLAGSLAVAARTNWSLAAIGPIPPLDAAYTQLHVLVLAGFHRTPHIALFFNPREVGGVASLALPPAVVLLWLQRKLARWRRLAAAAAVTMLVALLVLSQSVSGVCGALVALWLIAVISDEKRRARWIIATAATLALGFGAIVWRMSLAGGARLIAAESRPQPGLPHAAFGIESRLEIWQRALQMIHDMPYTGIGPGSFSLIMARFYPGFVLGPEPHAHDLWLESAVDFGVPGLIAFTWLLLGAALALVWAWRKQAQSASRAALLALGAGLAAYAFFGTIDVINLGSAPGLVLWAALGLALAAAHPSWSASWTRALNGSLLAGLAMVLVAPLTWDGLRLDAGHILAQKALVLPLNSHASSELTLAAGFLDAATRQHLHEPASLFVLARTQAALGNQPAALKAIQLAAAADSVQPLAHYSPLRAAALPAGTRPEATLREVYGNWIIRNPGDAVWYVADALAADQAGDVAGAREAVASGLKAAAQPAALLEACGASMGAPA